MKIALVLSALVAITIAAPLEEAVRPKFIPIVQFDEKHDDFGQFALSYTTGDGTKVTQQGQLKPTADGKDYVLVLSGSSEYTAPDGKVIRTSYTADGEGYHPVGDHLPVAPSA